MQKLKMHPDLGGDPEIASQINLAYATLSDNAKRLEYDASRTKQSVQSTNPSSTQTTPKGQPAPEKTANRVMWKKPDSSGGLRCEFCNEPHQFKSTPPLSSLCPRCASPLARAESQTNHSEGRRSLERLELQREIAYRWRVNAPLILANTSDLSLKGLKFSANDSLIKDQLIQIRSPFCLALGRIAHITQSNTVESQFGVEFVTLCFPSVSGSLVSTRA